MQDAITEPTGAFHLGNQDAEMGGFHLGKYRQDSHGFQIGNHIEADRWFPYWQP